MRILGLCLIGVGIIWAVIAFNMQTTVTSSPQTYGSGSYTFQTPSVTVNNIGLMARRRNNLIFAGLTILVGAILFGFGTISQKRTSTDKDLAACPYCAELVKPEASVCKHCGKEIASAFAEKRSLARKAHLESNRKELKELCIRLKAERLAYFEYQKLAGAAEASLGFTTGIRQKYLIKHEGKEIVFNRQKDLRLWFLKNIVPLVERET